MDMFPHAATIRTEYIIPLVCEHAHILENTMIIHYPHIATDNHDWQRSAFVATTTS
jgi:hypothetical protein